MHMPLTWKFSCSILLGRGRENMEYRQEIIHFSQKIPGKIFLHKIGSVSRHWHSSLELLYVCEGQVQIVVGDTRHTLEPDDLILINSLAVHELYSEGASMVAVQIDLSALEQFEEYRSCYFDCCSEGRSGDPRFDFIKHLVARMIKENTPKENSLLTLALFSLLINELVSNFQTKIPESIEIRQKSIQQMNAVVKYVREHYAENLSLGQLAREFHFSEAHLSRFFRQQSGVTFSQYYADIRLDHAVSELLTTRSSIADIAVGNGFSDSRAFVSAFKKRYGMLPSDYRGQRGTFIPDLKTKNEVNYLNVSTSSVLSKLARYLNADVMREFNFDPGQKVISTKTHTVSAVENGKKLRHTWRTLCTVGSTLDLLDERVRDMLRRMQREMPYRYIKFHGLLSDDLLLYSEDDEGKPQLSFVYFDRVMDFLQELRLKPLMQFCFMPAALASDPHKVQFFTKQNTSLPKSMENWRFLIRHVTEHCIRRYGLEEVKTWLFSVWNEPDTTEEMFGFRNPEDFFTLYRETCRTVKEICPEFRFGTPGMLLLPDDPIGWYRAFFGYCADNACVPDFVNLHYYNDEIELTEAGLAQSKQLISKLSLDPDAFHHYLDQVYATFSAYHLTGKPLYMTEWNLTVSHRNLINDTCFKSCYLVKTILENYDRLQSFGYWFLTDLAREQQLPSQLFHGGLGLFTANGIPKAHYNALLLLAGLEDVCLGAGKGWFVTANADRSCFSILFYHYEHYNEIFSSGEMFDMTDTHRYTPFSDHDLQEVSLRIRDLPNGRYRVTESYVNQAAGSSFDAWVRLGAPEKLTPYDVEYLKASSFPGRKISETDVSEQVLYYNQILEPLEVRLVQIRPFT